MEDMLTYEELRKIQKSERDKEQLQDLGADFVRKLRKYLEFKKKMGDKISNREFLNAKYVAEDIFELRKRKIMHLATITSNANSVKNLLEEEREFFEKISKAHELYKNKIGDVILKLCGESVGVGEESGGEVSEGAELKIERRIEEKVDEKASMNERDVEVKGGEEEEVESASAGGSGKSSSVEIGFKKILIRENIPKFLGYDMKSYGPFREGDIIEAPDRIARVLLDRKVAEVVM